MSPVEAWIFWIVGYVLPLAHVGLSPASGSWRPPEGSRCPFGPKAGWIVIVLFLGALGWLLFMTKRRRTSVPPGA